MYKMVKGLVFSWDAMNEWGKTITESDKHALSALSCEYDMVLSFANNVPSIGDVAMIAGPHGVRRQIDSRDVHPYLALIKSLKLDTMDAMLIGRQDEVFAGGQLRSERGWLWKQGDAKSVGKRADYVIKDFQGLARYLEVNLW